ncbi:hypothetical protein RUM43_008208 [Polyplax serrata]|uniref:Uncharacterized protein n=1 Tax=Polyplax serrata TaxID=468196 RepID=A0AAN8SAB7_POLSC
MATAVSEDEEDRGREKEGHPERMPWPTLIELFQVDRRAILDGYPQVLVDDVTSQRRIAVRFSGMRAPATEHLRSLVLPVLKPLRLGHRAVPRVTNLAFSGDFEISERTKILVREV